MSEKEEALKFVNDYLNKKPETKGRGVFWQTFGTWFYRAAKAYLRYEEIQSRK